MFKIIGTDDSINTCDCCGKTNLKATVIVEINGEILHYGSVCATRHTGLNAKEIKTAIQAEIDGRKMAAQKAYRNSQEYAAMSVKHNQARAAGVQPGRQFKEFCAIEQEAAAVKAREIAKLYNLEVCQIQ